MDYVDRKRNALQCTTAISMWENKFQKISHDTHKRSGFNTHNNMQTNASKVNQLPSANENLCVDVEIP